MSNIHSLRGNSTERGKYNGRASNRHHNNKTFMHQFGEKLPEKLTDAEKAKRKRDAMEFLYKETTSNHKTALDSVLEKSRAKSDNNRDPINRKTYELLRERPIRNISDRTRRHILRDDTIADNVARESLKFQRQAIPQKYGNDKLHSSNNKSTSSLLNSLSEFGSKLLGSILYNEAQTDLRRTSPVKSSYEIPQTKPILEQELNSTINLQQAKLDKINRDIETRKLMAMNEPLYENQYLQRKTEGIEDKLQSILKEVNNDSNDKLLKELLNIKDELIGLKKKQESNNMRFESRFEDLKLEQQRNKRNFDRMIHELDEKRDDLDREKDKIIRLLKKRKSTKQHTYRRDLSEISDSSSSEGEKYQPIKRVRINNDELMTKVDKLKKNMSKLT